MAPDDSFDDNARLNAIVTTATIGDGGGGKEDDRRYNNNNNVSITAAASYTPPGAFQGGGGIEDCMEKAQAAKKDHYNNKSKNDMYGFDYDNNNNNNNHNKNDSHKSYNEVYFDSNNNGDGGDDDRDNNNNNNNKIVSPLSLFRGEGAWFVYLMIVMTVLFLALMGYGFGSGLFIPNSGNKHHSVDGNGVIINGDGDGAFANNGSSDPSSYTVARQDYKYEIITLLGLPNVMERTSPQAQAIEWLAFEDEPLFVVSKESTTTNETTANNNNDIELYNYESHLERLEQRYSLVVWYFDQGGPKLWTTINREPSSGWINFGADIHECQWKGIDCEYNNDKYEGDDSDGGVVVGVRLSPTLGVVLTGTSLSTELGLLTSLRRLDFSDQRLQGTIPQEWSKMTDLESVILSNNQLQTTIPEWVGKEWTKLETLVLDGNLCYGDIPSSLSTLTGLRYFDVQQNKQLTGRFDEILMMSSSSTASQTIEYIDISYTDLIGSLPSSSSNSSTTTLTVPNLRVFRAWNTRGLEGIVPSDISSWSNLEVLTIDESPNLQGTIPSQLGLLSNLKTLEILRSGTNFYGTFPSELGLLSNLETFNFRGNNHNGTLPVEYSQLTKLQRMDVQSNKVLTGTLPAEYGNLVNLKYLDLRGTSMVGEVSEEVCAIDFEFLMADCNGKTSNEMICVCCLRCNKT